ncbi:MAG: hypothetical protein ACFFAS_05310 [Promethearchaeota archaeon]
MTESELLFIGVVYESFIIIVAAIILALIFNKYIEKRHNLTLILFVIFTFYLITIIFTWLSKILDLLNIFYYVDDKEASDPLTIESFFVLRIVDYRVSFIFLALATLFTYVLRVKLFEEGYKRNERLFVALFGVFTIVFQVVIYIKGDPITEILSFLLITIYMFAVNIPFMNRCFSDYRAVDNPTFKKGFLSLTIMSLFASLILIFQSLDRLLLIFGTFPYGFSPFYFIGMICVLLAYFGAYFGYIRPRSKD